MLLLLARSGSGDVVINEFMADNNSTLEDSYGRFSDWIELYNASTGAVSLAGWSLTVDAANLHQWVFPAVTLPAGGYRVVFA